MECMIDDGFFCQVNSATTIPVRAGYSIYVVSATANFTANGVAVVVGTNNALNFACPFKVSTAITSATVGTVFYFYQK